MHIHAYMQAYAFSARHRKGAEAFLPRPSEVFYGVTEMVGAGFAATCRSQSASDAA